MAGFTHINLRADVEDRAPANGMDGIEARFATGALGSEASGLSLQRIAPGVRQPFAHRHASQEEVYVVVEGGGRVKLDDDILDLALWDAVRVPGPVWRCFEAGADGMTFVVVGAPPMADPRGESELERGWWSD
jgi:mannose-6-phosphate isomerase-like protein (cupin superfamily)